jgi:hypothetical protein
MKLAIMQPYFFPFIGYFQAIKAVDKYILYENLDYIKDGWMNRNRVLIKNQNPAYFSVTLQGSSSNKKIHEIELNTSFNWRRKLLNKLFLNYKGSPFFDESYNLIEECINIEGDMLSMYNSQIINKIADYLEINTEIQYDNQHYLPLEQKLAEGIIQNTNYETKLMRVFEICKQEKANVFLNAIGGRTLYDKKRFKKNGIDLFFVETEDIVYKQFSGDFHPNLSIIDVLMHNGKDKTNDLLKNYKLI